MQHRFIKNFILALALGVISGCTNIEHINAIQATADAALAEAKAATAKANGAHNIASEAAYAADQADTKAVSALNCCNDNASRLDRMFEKAMSK